MKDRDVIETVQRLTRNLRGRVNGLVRRATLGTLNVAGKLQTLQAKTLADDVDDDVELFEQYGITSAPPAGSEGLVLRVGGERGHSVAICFGKRSARFAGLEQGEVALYNEAGAAVVLRNDGAIEVTPGQGAVVKLGAVEGGQAVARANDPIALSEANVAALVAMFEVIFSDSGAPLVGLPMPPGITTPTGTGTITSGGTGSVST